jgi:hypothetical protein
MAQTFVQLICTQSGVACYMKGHHNIGQAQSLSASGILVNTRSDQGKTSIAVHQWTAKQSWVDRQSFKQEDNIYCLEKVQIIK